MNIKTKWFLSILGLVILILGWVLMLSSFNGTIYPVICFFVCTIIFITISIKNKYISYKNQDIKNLFFIFVVLFEMML